MKTYEVRGSLYGETPNYYSWDVEKKFPYFSIEGKCVWSIQAETLEDAVKWLATNHPEYYMGAGVECKNTNEHEFYLTAVPSGEYGDGNYETIEARKNFIAKRYGL